ncbi:putative nuclease HARBI1 [Prorops nasuta]|uniref:putative nuclease HARBI1 n=1 Tax=Prorops nasuta TaxID=863751 RepID=UPI0034CED1CE
MYNENEFLKRYRFSKYSTIYGLLPLVEDDLKKINNRGSPIPPIIQLIIALRYYATNNYQIVSEDLVGIRQQSVCNVVFRITNLIASFFRKYIYFPKNAELMKENEALFTKLGYGEGAIGLPNISGAIDCTHIRLINVRLHGQSEVYRNRKGYYSLNVQRIVGPKMEFLDLVPEWPGSQHDSTIFQNSRAFVRFREQQTGGMLVGDKGYPSLPFLLTPFRNPRSSEEEKYNEIHSRTRMVVERAFGVWKRRFSCLSTGLTLKLESCTSVVAACAVLHNLSLMFNEVIPELDNDLPITENIPDNEDYNENESRVAKGIL